MKWIDIQWCLDCDTAVRQLRYSPWELCACMEEEE